MNIQERIAVMVQAGQYLLDNASSWQTAKNEAYSKNAWFTPIFTQHAANQIANQYLTAQALQAWVAQYNLVDNIVPVQVGIVMAGNIPMVGFADMLAVFISGHYQTIKCSSKDAVLIKQLVQYLYTLDVEVQNYISFADRLNDCDAYIATGGSHAASAFEEYFGKYPCIIRKNKTAVAVLTGEETAAELAALADDVHVYFGLGCRNVTKLYVPQGYDFVPLLQSFSKYTYFADHHTYKNNYDYNLAIILLNHVYYMTNEATILTENDALFSPISQLFFEYYTQADELYNQLQNNKDIQCIVGKAGLAFGQAQCPSLFNYADGVDTMQFLKSLR